MRDYLIIGVVGILCLASILILRIDAKDILNIAIGGLIGALGTAKIMSKEDK